MQNYSKTIGALVAASALVAGNASAEIEYELNAGYASEYIFRGQNYGTDLTSINLNLETEYNGFGLAAGVWSGSFHKGGFGSNTLTETDVFGAVSKDLGFATAAIGYIYYFNFGTGSFDDAGETYFSLAQTYFGVDFALAYYWDVTGNDNEGYTQLTANKGFELSPCLTLNTGAVLGYLAEQGTLDHLTVKVALDYAMTETATLSPFVAHSWDLGDVGLNFSQANELVGGAMISVSF